MPDSIARQIADHNDYTLSGELSAAGGVYGIYDYPVAIAVKAIQVRVAPNGVPIFGNTKRVDLSRFITDAGLAGAEAFASLSDALHLVTHRISFSRLHILVEPGTYTESEFFLIPNAAHVHIEGLGAGSVHNIGSLTESRAEELELENVTFNFQNQGDYFFCHGQLVVTASTPVAINASDPTQLAMLVDHFRSSGTTSFTGWVSVLSDLWVIGQININSSEPDGIALKCDGRWHVGVGGFSTPGQAKKIVMGESGAMNGDYLTVAMQDGAGWSGVNEILQDNGWHLDTRSQVATQWGRATGATGGATSDTQVTFPSEFRIRPFAIVVCSEAGDEIFAPRFYWTATGFTVLSKTPTSPIGDFTWIAVGV
jgi:hypothetical protein